MEARKQGRGARLFLVLNTVLLALCVSACVGMPGGGALGRVSEVSTYINKYAKCYGEYGSGCDTKAVETSRTHASAFTPEAFHLDEPDVGLSQHMDGGIEVLTELRVDPARVAAAKRVMTHPFIQQLGSMVDSAEAASRAAEAGRSVPTQEARFSACGIDSFLRACNQMPPDALVHLRAALLHQSQNAAAGADLRPLQFVTFAEAYFKAYFRQGKFFRIEVSLKVIYEALLKEITDVAPGISKDDLEKLIKERLPALLKRYLSDDQLKDVNRIVKLLMDGDEELGFAYGSEGDGKFISCTGAELRAPFIVLKFDLSKPLEEGLPTGIDFKQIGQDLLRLMIEAAMDTLLGTPAVPEATGANITNNLALKLPKYDTKKCKTVTPAEYALVQRYANQIDASVGAAVGRLVRGGGPIALNNEALATILETALATFARKLTEKAIWCAAVHSKLPTGVTDASEVALYLGSETSLLQWDLQVTK